MTLTERYERISSPLACFIGYSFYIGAGGFCLILAWSIAGLGLFHPRWARFVFRHMIRWFMYVLSCIVLPALGVFRARERSGFKDLPKGPVIMVCNHYGMLDGPLILPERARLSAIMKAKYAHSFPYSLLVRYLGYIPIDRGSLTSLVAAMDDAKRQMAEGTSLLVFPEGTRSGGRRLLPFMEFAFRLAIECRVPIVPVVIHMTEPFMAKELSSFFPIRRNSISIHALPPVLPDEYSDAGEMAEAVRVRMIREQQKIEKEIAATRRSRGR